MEQTGETRPSSAAREPRVAFANALRGVAVLSVLLAHDVGGRVQGVTAAVESLRVPLVGA